MNQLELDSRCKLMLETLLHAHGFTKIKTFADQFHISKRSVYYDICKINDYLIDNQVAALEIVRGKGIYLDKTHRLRINELLLSNTKSYMVVYSPFERMILIICMMIINEHLTIESFVAHCQVSRNTIINDLKIVQARLHEYGLECIYSRKDGYQINGDEIKKRTLFFLYFPDLMMYYHQSQFSFIDELKVNENIQKLTYIEKTLDNFWVEGTSECLAIFYSKSLFNKSPNMSSKDKLKIKETFEFDLVKQQFPHLIQNEQLYMTIHILGSRLQTLPLDLMNLDQDDEAYELAKALVSEFSQIACVEFLRKDDLIRNIFIHLKSSLYRYRFGLVIGNALVDDIKVQYKDLFAITQRVVSYLSTLIGVPIHDNEIAYLTLHFGSHLLSNHKINPKILVICPNGLSTGNMLKNEIQSLINHYKQIDVYPLEQIHSIQESYDLIISTVYIPKYQDAIIVHPILSDEDRMQILKRCMNPTMSPQIEAEEMVQLIKPYIDLSQVDTIKHILSNYILQQNRIQINTQFKRNLGLIDYLDSSLIQICQSEINWQDAIDYAAHPLIGKSIIKKSYIEAIIKLIRTMGMYMFITPEIVLAHAKIEDGAMQTGVSLTLFKQPVIFDKKHHAKIIVTLSTIDQSSHLKILSDLMCLCQNDFLKDLYLMDSPELLLNKMKGIISNCCTNS